jgi:[ribosomal protein S5]-alanine N-acetyltransferase
MKQAEHEQNHYQGPRRSRAKNHLGNPGLKAESKNRVSIRPPVDADCAAFLAAVRRSRALHRNWVNPKQATKSMFAKHLKRYSSGSHHGFLVIHRETGDIAGVINVNDVIRGGFQCATVGYYAFAPYAGRGLMREGLRLVLKHAFTKLKLHRLEAHIVPSNRASIALVKKCGFRREGLSRRSGKVCGRWRDQERFALLAEDFLKRK